MKKKQRKMKIDNASYVKYDIYVYNLCFSSSKNAKTTQFAQNWLDHLLLMMSYLVTIVTDSHQTRVKMCLRDMPKATENGRCL